MSTVGETAGMVDKVQVLLQEGDVVSMEGYLWPAGCVIKASVGNGDRGTEDADVRLGVDVDEDAPVKDWIEDGAEVGQGEGAVGCEVLDAEDGAGVGEDEQDHDGCRLCRRTPSQPCVKVVEVAGKT
ncbi:hypothetical protein C8F01DRAFT_1081491 [Mycena amicta]|nr:hypothetical protein C8F01DRAFT_1081491 [Mycena amicta]